MLKKIITCGCSFADTSFSWDRVLKDNLLSFNPNLEFEFLGLGSQGNELIQKKTSLAIFESLSKFKPEEIAVFVMWSGTERKTFYYNNTEEIEKLIKFWQDNKQYWGYQFFDLKNSLGKDYKKLMINEALANEYNFKEGWTNFNFLFSAPGLPDEYFKSTIDNIHAVHITIENIIMLQNFCKINNIPLFQQFYRSYVYDDIVNNKEHQIINYLYNFLDQSTIISTTGIYEYLHDIVSVTDKSHRWEFAYAHLQNNKYFGNDGVHPNELGHKIWTDEIIIPFLHKNNFIKQWFK